VIDPRGPRFGAAITSVVLAAVVLTGSPWLLLLQALLFGYNWLVGVQASPYGRLYRKLIRPRLGPPVELEDPRPPRFAQLVGFLVTAVGWVVAVLGGGSVAVVVAGGLAFVAAFLNAAFGLCLGCELYIVLVRLGMGPPGETGADPPGGAPRRQ
jgi:hypothetical protein